MPVAILALGLMAVLVLVILAVYGFALWFTLLVMGFASLALLTVNVYLTQAVLTTFVGTFPIMLRRGFTVLTSAVGYVLLGAVAAVPVAVTLLLVGVDVHYFYPPLARYEALVVSIAKSVYDLMWMHPIGTMTLTRLFEIVVGAEAAWGAVLLGLTLVFGLLMLLRIHVTGEAAGYIKGNDTEEG